MKVDWFKAVQFPAGVKKCVFVGYKGGKWEIVSAFE